MQMRSAATGDVSTTHRADEEVFVEPRDEPEVGLEEHSIHDPHDIASAAIESGHDEWHVRG